MTQPTAAPILLIDGNNLAHFLYTNLVPGQKMTADDSRRLIDHLSSYARSYAGQVHVELCLDRSPGAYDLPPENLHIFAAEYPQTGDDLLLGRFWFHQMARRPCLVITNDDAILEEVREARGNSLRVYDFVRRPGITAPVLRDPQDLPPLPGADTCLQPVEKAPSLSASIYFRIVQEDRQAEKTTPKGERTVRQPPEQTKTTESKPGTQAVPQPKPEHAVPKAADALPPKEAVPEQPAETRDGPYYFLSLETWPVAEGIRFLRNAFCRQHRGQYLDLVEAFNPQTLTPADLRALAELLLHTCGDEPDFARRGSLMARVRLALLQARGEPLVLDQIAQATGLKQTGLHGRIKDKAENWIMILQD